MAHRLLLYTATENFSGRKKGKITKLNDHNHKVGRDFFFKPLSLPNTMDKYQLNANDRRN